jgi:hypothetical protein
MVIQHYLGGDKMGIDSWTKLAVVVIVSIAATFLGYAGRIDSQAVVALLSAALGYVFGNGHGIISAQKQLEQIKQNQTGAEQNGK